MKIANTTINFPYFVGTVVAFSLFNLPPIGNFFLPGHVVASLIYWGRHLNHMIVEIEAYILISTTFHVFDVSMHSL